MAARTPRRGRKLLVASIGVAAVSYVACGGTTKSGKNTVNKDAGADHQGYDAVANLVAPDVNQNDVVANLVAPPDAGADAPEDHGSQLDVVANLVPPPLDGGD